jgi:hypothetical protein
MKNSNLGVIQINMAMDLDPNPHQGKMLIRNRIHIETNEE